MKLNNKDQELNFASKQEEEDDSGAIEKNQQQNKVELSGDIEDIDEEAKNERLKFEEKKKEGKGRSKMQTQ